MSTPTRQELLEEIERTKHEIVHLQTIIENCTDPKEKRRLQRQLKEFQYLQLWRLEQLQNEYGSMKKAFTQIPEVIAAIKEHHRLPDEWRYLFKSTALDEDPYCVIVGSEFRPMIRIDLPLQKDKDGFYVIRYRE